MSADIEKLAVFDARIIQSRPKYAVQKGALSVTNAPFNAIAASASQHSYNIYVPSENVFVDRGLEWSSTAFLQFDATITFSSAPVQTQFAGVTPLIGYGRDFALPPLPLNQLCSTLTATINDTTSVINSQDVVNPILRLTDYKDNRRQRTCPTMLDKYQSYDDAYGAVNNPLSGWNNSTQSSEVPNGAFYNTVFTQPNGGVADGLVPAPAAGYTQYTIVNGVPCVPYTDSGTGGVTLSAGVAYKFRFYFRFTSTEKLVLSPFTFADAHEWDTGLFGINNIQLIMNLQAPSRLIRATTRASNLWIDGSSIQYNATSTSGPFADSRINVIFLTPSLDVPLPPKSVVPYMEYPRYITQYSAGSIAAGKTGQIQSQTITLPTIPDMFIIYAKPTQYTVNEVSGATVDPTQGDWYLPLATRADSVQNPLSINFDNFSGLLSSVTTEQLYAMSVKNGLDMDWDEWVGVAHNSSVVNAVPYANSTAYTVGTVVSYGGQLWTAIQAVANTNTTPPSLPTSGASVWAIGAVGSSTNQALGAGRVPLVGGPLVLRPSQDVTLQTGQAPSLVGNFTFQFNITVKNTSAYAVTPQLYVITVNSGFFESIRGSSRIIKGVLSEQDIISAPLAPMATHDQLARMVGSGGLFSSLSNVLSKAKDVYEKTKPYHGAIKSAAEEAMKSVHGGEVGAAVGAGRRKLSQRLM